MHRMSPHLSGLLVLLCTLSLVIHGQGDQKDKHTAAVKANVLVVDEKKQYVSGLSASDLKIFEGDAEQKVTSISELDPALDLVILADNSGSVRQQLDKITSICKLLVANLRPADQAMLIRFVGREHIEVFQPWTSNKVELAKALDQMYVEGGQSAVIDALYLASGELIKRQSNAKNRRYAIVLISDAEDRSSYYTEKQLFKLIDGNALQIFTITLTKDLPKSLWDQPSNRQTASSVIKFSNRLVSATGGTTFIVREKTTADELTNALKALVYELRAQYVVTYTARDINKDNNARRLRATAADGPNGEKRTAIIRDTIILEP